MAVLSAALGTSVAYSEREYARLSRTLERDVGAARETRWERPVLRGAMGDGNAADDIYAALAEWRPLEPAMRRDLAQNVYYGMPLSAAQRKALEERGTALRALRAAAQQRWSHTDLAVERGSRMRVPDYPKAVEASLGLLAQAQTQPPEACLQTAADVVRIGQDLVPSAPLEAVSVAARLTGVAARAAARCARHADLASLRKAAHELRVLATHPAPVGSALETEQLAAAAELQQRAALTDKPASAVFDTILARPQLLAAWSSYGGAARAREFQPERYPETMEDFRREQDFRARQSPLHAKAAPAILAHIQDDMRGQAYLRMLCVAVSTLAERAYRGTLPSQPSALRDEALRDPFRGQPFRYRIAPNGVEFSLWSVGADLRDDDGSDEWTEAGPRDVTLHVALR